MYKDYFLAGYWLLVQQRVVRRGGRGWSRCGERQQQSKNTSLFI